MVDGSNPAYALAIAQAIARGQGTPQQRSAYLGQVVGQMRANAAAARALHQEQLAGALHQQQQLAGPGSGGFDPAHAATQEGLANQAFGQHVAQQQEQQAFSGLAGHPLPPPPSGGAGLAPPGHPQMPLPSPSGGQPWIHPVGYPGGGQVNPGGPMQGINPGGPIQRPGGPVRPIGPARPGTIPYGRTGPVKPIGPARPPARGGLHYYGPGGSGVFGR